MFVAWSTATVTVNVSPIPTVVLGGIMLKAMFGSIAIWRGAKYASWIGFTAGVVNARTVMAEENARMMSRTIVVLLKSRMSNIYFRPPK